MRVSAYYEEKFRVLGLTIEPALALAKHSFPFEDRKIEIQLPALPVPGASWDEHSDAHVLAPLTLTRLVLTTLAGVFLFDEKPDPLTVAGILLILFSCWMAMRPAPTETRDRQATAD